MKIRFYVPARAQRGAASVEFALVMSLLITLVLGIISYGFMLAFRQGMSQGAAEGARAAAVAFKASDQLPDARAAIDDALRSYGVSCNADGTLRRSGDDVGSCAVEVTTCDGGRSCVNVTLAYDYRDNSLVPSFPGMGLVLPEQLTYTASARVS